MFFVTVLILYVSTTVDARLLPIKNAIIQKLNSGPITEDDIYITGHEIDSDSGIFYSYVGRFLHCSVNSSLTAHSYMWTRLNDGQQVVGQFVTLNTAGQNLRYSCQATITEGASSYTANRTISLNVFPAQVTTTMRNNSAIQQPGSQFKFAILLFILLHLKVN